MRPGNGVWRMIFVRQGPMWFRLLTIALVLWALVGCFSCIQQLRLGADAMGAATDYDRAVYAALPRWYDLLFVIAVMSGLIGAILLFMRRATARPFLVVSLVAITLQFGWLFATTDIVAHKGAAETLTVPVAIAAIALAAIWLAGHARRNSWTL